MANARSGLTRAAVLLCLVATLVTTGTILGGLGIVSAAPGEPISFYGEATDADGDSASVGTIIIAAVDGNEVDRVTVSEAGVFASDSPTAEKLRTHTEAGDTVTFHVGSTDGPQADQTHDIGDSGAFELHLTFPPGTFTGDSDDSLPSDDGGSEVSTSEAPTSSDGGGSGVPTSEAPPTDGGTQQVVTEDLVDSDPAEAGVQVAVSEGPVTELSFEEEGLDGMGEVSVTTYETAPTGVTDEFGPDSVVVAVGITVPPVAEDSPARIRFRLPAEEIGDRSLNSLRVVRVIDGQNQVLPTEVSEASDGSYVVEADSPGFSTFAVVFDRDDTTRSRSTTSPETQTSTPSSPQTTEAAPSTETNTETRTETSGGVAGFGPMIAILALLGAGYVSHRRAA